MNLKMVSLGLIIIGLCVAVAGSLLMAVTPAIPPSDFEVTASDRVPANEIAILVPIGLIIAGAGGVVLIFDLTVGGDMIDGPDRSGKP